MIALLCLLSACDPKPRKSEEQIQVSVPAAPSSPKEDSASPKSEIPVTETPPPDSGSGSSSAPDSSAAVEAPENSGSRDQGIESISETAVPSHSEDSSGIEAPLQTQDETESIPSGEVQTIQQNQSATAAAPTPPTPPACPGPFKSAVTVISTTHKAARLMNYLNKERNIKFNQACAKFKAANFNENLICRARNAAGAKRDLSFQEFKDHCETRQTWIAAIEAGRSTTSIGVQEIPTLLHPTRFVIEVVQPEVVKKSIEENRPILKGKLGVLQDIEKLGSSVDVLCFFRGVPAGAVPPLDKKFQLYKIYVGSDTSFSPSLVKSTYILSFASAEQNLIGVECLRSQATALMKEEIEKALNGVVRVSPDPLPAAVQP